MDVQTKNILLEVGKGTLVTALGFGAGCLTGHLVSGPVLITGAIYSISALASFALDHLAKFLANKFDWNLSTVKFVQALAGAVLTVATSVALFAMGIFGPIGLGVTLGVGLLLSAALPLGLGLYAKFGGKDMVYKDAVALVNQEQEAKLSDLQNLLGQTPEEKKVDGTEEGVELVSKTDEAEAASKEEKKPPVEVPLFYKFAI